MLIINCYTAEQRVVFVLSSGIGIPLQYWNRKMRRISKDLPLAVDDVQQLETGITEKLRKAEDIVTYALKQRSTCPMKFLKENFHLHKNWNLEQMSDAEKNLGVYFNIDDDVKSKQSTIKHCTINVINARTINTSCTWLNRFKSFVCLGLKFFFSSTKLRMA